MRSHGEQHRRLLAEGRRATLLATMIRERAKRAMAGGTVVAAILLQLVIAPPLAMRMLSAAHALWPAVLCGNASSHQPSTPAPLHHHDLCPLCMGHSLPMALSALAAVLLTIGTRWHRVLWAVGAAQAPRWAFSFYRSRAPPALA